KADHVIGFLGQVIHNFRLALVAPLGAHDNTIGHTIFSTIGHDLDFPWNHEKVVRGRPPFKKTPKDDLKTSSAKVEKMPAGGEPAPRPPIAPRSRKPVKTGFQGVERAGPGGARGPARAGWKAAGEETAGARAQTNRTGRDGWGCAPATLWAPCPARRPPSPFSTSTPATDASRPPSSGTSRPCSAAATSSAARRWKPLSGPSRRNSGRRSAWPSRAEPPRCTSRWSRRASDPVTK